VPGKAPLTASGAYAVEGVTVASDWGTLLAGTVVDVECVGRRTVQDRMPTAYSRKYNGRVIDVYMTDHEAARRFGRKECEVWAVALTGEVLSYE